MTNNVVLGVQKIKWRDLESNPMMDIATNIWSWTEEQYPSGNNTVINIRVGSILFDVWN